MIETNLLAIRKGCGRQRASDLSAKTHAKLSAKCGVMVEEVLDNRLRRCIVSASKRCGLSALARSRDANSETTKSARRRVAAKRAANYFIIVSVELESTAIFLLKWLLALAITIAPADAFCRSNRHRLECPDQSLKMLCF